MAAFSADLLVFFVQVPVFETGTGRQWAAPYNADIATGMD
jgi:hypothetical protein